MTRSVARGPVRIAAAGALLALLLSGCQRSLSGAGDQLSPVATTRPGAISGAGVQGTQAPQGTPGGAGVAGPGAVPGAGDDNLVTLDGSARSVETTATIGGLSSVHLAGPSVLTTTGHVIDRAGRDLGTGSLRADGSDLLVTGATMALTAHLRVQPGLVTVSNGDSGAVGLGFTGTATVSAAHLTFQPPPPPAPPATVAVPGSPATVATTTTVPPPVPVSGPVSVSASGVQISGGGLQFVNAPADLSVAAGEADFSWAGQGSITTATGPLRATYLGVRAQQLQVELRRAAGGVALHGTGLALQAYVNGVPQLRVPARIDVLSQGATTGFLGRRHAFVWTPRNLGNTYDMAILSIHPGNAAASGVHLGLRPMPPMFGGEPHALVGGDTAGLKGGDTIDSLVARHGDDKRSIGYDAPPGVTLVLIITGNFDPITVTVTTY